MPFDLQPTLTGELLALRSLRADDFHNLYAVASDPPATLMPVRRRLPSPSIPEDLSGLFDATESIPTHALESPDVRRNRLQFVTRPPAEG